MLRRLYQGIIKSEAVVAGTFLVIMVALVFLNGVLRMAGHPINWAIDIATALFAWAAFMCADVAWRRNSLMSIDFVTSRLPPAAQKALRLFNYALIVAFLGFVLVLGVYLSWISRARAFQGIPGVSYSWVTMSMPAGALLLLITTFLKIRGEFPPRALDRPVADAPNQGRAR